MTTKIITFILILLFQALCIVSMHSGQLAYTTERRFVTPLNSRQNPQILAQLDAFMAKYKALILSTNEQDQRAQLLTTIPSSREEALHLLMREVLLYQQIFQEQVRLLEAIDARPRDHQDLLQHLKEVEIRKTDFYINAKLNTSWLNILIRWIGWIVRHPEAGQDKFDRLFKMLFYPYKATLPTAEMGFEHDLEGIKDRFSVPYTLVLIKCREVHSEACLDRRAAWFHDIISPQFQFYSMATHLLLPFISGPALLDKCRENERDREWPAEYNRISEIIFNRVSFMSRKHASPTLKLIDDQYHEVFKVIPFKVASDVVNEQVDDGLFETSFIDPLGLNGKKPSRQVTSLPKVNPSKISKKGKAQGKKKSAQRKQGNKGKKPAQSSVLTIVADDLLVEDDNLKILAEEKSSYTSSKTTSDISKQSALSSISNESSKAIPEPVFINEEKVTVKAITVSAKEGKSEDVSDDDQNWQEHLSQEIKKFELEKKKEAQIRKVIRQQERDLLNSERRARIRQHLKKPFNSSSSAKSLENPQGKASPLPTDVIPIDATELCLAFPESHSLFLSNKKISMIKAKHFRWFFDPRVVIEQEHMNFLCILFNLEPGKGQLTFNSMSKVFWAIEKCFYGKEEFEAYKEMKRTNTKFEWSHRFEINGVQVSPIKKVIHPEHESSRFSQADALTLFSSGGFDPRFFTPGYD